MEGDSPRCPACKGTNTHSKDVFRPSPSLLLTILIGWLYLLPRAAFFPKMGYCDSCEEDFSYRTIGSNVAVVILITLIALVVWAGINGEEIRRGY